MFSSVKKVTVTKKKLETSCVFVWKGDREEKKSHIYMKRCYALLRITQLCDRECFTMF